MVVLVPCMPEEWSPNPPNEEGWYWFYGDPMFGSMGGHFAGTVPPRLELHTVKCHRISNGFAFVCDGHFMASRPFDRNRRAEGYVGVWQRAHYPALPLHLKFDHLIPPQHA